MIVFPFSFVKPISNLDEGLIIHLDANNPSSYPGTGTAVFDLAGPYDHTLTGATYTVLNGIRCFDCTTGTKRVVVDGTGPALPTSGYTYITWTRINSSSVGWRSLLRTNNNVPTLVQLGTDDLGYYDVEFRDSGYNVTPNEDVWVQYAVVGDNTSSVFYINGTQVGTVAYGAGGDTHKEWGNNGTAIQPWGYVANLYLYNRKLSFPEIIEQYNTLSPAFNLVLDYNTFNTSSYNGSGTTITDLSGNSRNGTVTGSPTWTSNYFTFSDDYVTTPNLSSVIPISNEVHSVEVWVYPTDNGVLVQYNGTPTPNASYHFSAIEIVGGNLEVGLWNGNAIASTGNIGAVSFNQWHQIVLTYNGSVCRGYLDGVFKGSANVSFSSPMDDSLSFYMNFGYRTITNQGDGSDFNGRFGIMRVYNTALTDAQVLSNYNSTLSTIVNITTDGLVLYYDPSSTSSYPGSGTTITDLSGNGRNGTMSNISFTSPYFAYNGSSSQVSIADNALLEPGSGSWTMEIWVNQSTSGNDVVLGKFDPGGLTIDVSYSIRTTGTAYYAQIGSGSGSGSTLFVNSTSYTGTINTWYQIVYVFKNGATKTLETFVNGSTIGTVSHGLASILNTPSNLYIGSYNNGEYSQWFDGKIGITRLYNTALTSSQVLQNYNADKSKYGL
jgi:hypothetical protein